MKLVCDSCGTKYSVGDDRVAGKVFKIRCKKCSHVILVRGAQAIGEPAPASSDVDEARSPGASDWHAVIDGQQVGPFDPAEVTRRRAAGELDDDSYVWREGMADWLPLGSIDELRAGPSRGAPSPIAPALAPDPIADEPRLRGERNESSVLFTLGNLARLAAPAPVATAAVAQGEGSGLIDIRALASSLAPASAQRTPTPTTIAGELGADLPIYTPTGFGEPIVIVPMPRAHADRRLVVALAAMVAVLAVFATVLVVVMTRDAPRLASRPVATQVATAEPAAPPRSSAPAPRAASDAVTEPASEAARPLTAPAATAPASPPTPPVTTPAVRPARPPVNGRRATAPAGGATARPVPPALRLADDKCTEVSCVVSGYAERCCEAFRPRHDTTPDPRPTANLPDALDRTALTEGIATIKAQACGGRSPAHGDVKVSIKVAPGGTVANVTIRSTPDDVLGACVTAAAQRGSFAKTKRGGTFSYLWRF